MAATMLGQGKNVWQAEIDSINELVDFLRFNCRSELKMLDPLDLQRKFIRSSLLSIRPEFGTGSNIDRWRGLFMQ